MIHDGRLQSFRLSLLLNGSALTIEFGADYAAMSFNFPPRQSTNLDESQSLAARVRMLGCMGGMRDIGLTLWGAWRAPERTKAGMMSFSL
jgi:hypothetical protein